MTKSLSIDIGGSSVKSGIFDSAEFSEKKPLQKRFEPQAIEGAHFDDVKSAVFKALRVGLASEDISRIGISTTGSVWPNGVVKSAGHFEGYSEIDWGDLIRKEFDSVRSVAVENDGKASAWSEFSYFGAEDESHVHYVLGTGVGSSTVIKGQLMHGDSGEAGFLGHTVVTNEETIICSCDRQGCVETIASAPGLIHEISKRKGKPVKNFEEFLTHLSRRDTDALQTLEFACKCLGNITGVLANSFNPKNVTFGGGVILGIREATTSFGEPNLFLDLVSKELRRVAFSRTANSTKLHYGVFDNDGGLVGAGLLAKNT